MRAFADSISQSSDLTFSPADDGPVPLMKRLSVIKNICALLCLLLVLCGCGSGTNPSLTKTVFCMDTLLTITASGARAEEALERSEQELFRLDALLNRHSQTSTVSELNRVGSLKNHELAGLLRRVLFLNESTCGAFDCTLAPLIDIWDIAGGGHVPTSEELSAALALTGTGSRITVSDDTVTLVPGTALDLGGVGKGYAGELVRTIFSECGVSGSICLGGDNCLVGPRSAEQPLWRVGLRMPGSQDDIVCILSVTDTFIVTSGSYERFFKADDDTVYHHILDPETGWPAQNGLVSVTVLTNDGVAADALATAFFVMGEEKTKAWLLSHPDVSAILITEDHRITFSSALSDVLTQESEAYSYEAF